MQDCEELDDVPQKIAEGSMSVEDAAMKVMEAVYTNPGRFNLLDMTEDGRSDFLLEILPKFRRMVERYDKSQGPLGAYVYYSLPGLRLTWEKRHLDNATGRRAVKRSVKNIYTDELYERRLKVAEPPVFEERKIPKNKSDKPLVFKRIFGPQKRSLLSRNALRCQRAALILALKSAWYIDDDKVEQLSGYFGCSNKAMEELLDKVKNSLVERNEKRRDMAERRDKAWYFVCKYRERLLSLDPNSEDWRVTKRKLDYQLSSWKSKNLLLQGCRMNVSIRNTELAKILNMHPHRVSLFLRRAKKMAEAGETLVPNEGREEG